MNTKEKLELLWKYLLLLVIAVFLIRFSGKPHFKMMGKHFDHGKHKMSFHGDNDREIDVRVEKEIVNGDTLMKVTVNGGKIDSDSFTSHDGKLEWKSKDGKKMVIDIDDFDGEPHSEEDHKKVVKKRIVIKEIDE